MNDFNILSSCQELQQNVIDAKARLEEARGILAGAVIDLDAAVKKLGSSISTQEKQQLTEIVKRARAIVEGRLKAVKEAEEALTAAIAIFFGAGLTTCEKPPRCEINLTKNLFTVTVGPQTTPPGNLALDLQNEKDTEDKLKKQIADLEQCLSKLRDKTAWNNVRRSGNTYASDFGLLTQIGLTEAELRAAYGAGWQGTNGTRCAPTMGDAFLDILTNATNWRGNMGVPSVLIPSAKTALNRLTETVREALNARLKVAEGHLDIVQKNILDLELEIRDRANPNSDKNRKKRSDMTLAGNRIVERCLKNVKYAVEIVITAAAGPIYPPAGAGGVSYTISDEKARNCIQADGDGTLTLHKDRAAANLPTPGGCNTEDALWKYPINITATITIQDVDKLTVCIGPPPQIIAAEYDASVNGTITTNHTGSVTLTACISNPDKK